METLVLIDDLIARLPFVMDDDETREANGALDDLSDEARQYGSDLWETPAQTPRSVKNLILKAASRHMKNYDGFVQSRAGDETLVWSDRGEDAGSAYFTTRERQALRQTAGGSTLHTVNQVAWGSSSRSINRPAYVPCAGTDTPFPYFTETSEPW